MVITYSIDISTVLTTRSHAISRVRARFLRQCQYRLKRIKNAHKKRQMQPFLQPHSTVDGIIEVAVDRM